MNNLVIQNWNVYQESYQHWTWSTTNLSESISSRIIGLNNLSLLRSNQITNFVAVADQVIAEEAFSLHPERGGRASLAEKGGSDREFGTGGHQVRDVA